MITDFMVQLNWHLVWQSAIVMLASWCLCSTLVDRPSSDHSFLRLRVWSFACLSPLFIVPLTAAAAVFQWRLYSKLLVWHLLFPQGVSLNPSTFPKIASPGVHWIAFGYFAWLWVYLSLTILQFVRLEKWMRVNQVTEYEWEPQEQAVFEEICRRFRIRRRPAVYQVEANVAPFTYCWWQPAIILPSRFYHGGGDLGEMRAVLAHEVAHIRYGHLRTNGLLSLVVWLFPLSRLSLWRANRRLRHEMELVADAIAVQVGGADECVLKKTLCRHIQKDHLLPSTLGFAATLVERLDRKLGRPLAQRIRRIWFMPTLCAVVSQLNFLAPPFSVAGPLVAASIAPQIVTSLQPFTQSYPIYQPNYPVYQPVQLPPQMLTPMRIPPLDYSRFRPVEIPRIETQPLPYRYRMPQPMPYIPPTLPQITLVPAPRVYDPPPTSAALPAYQSIPVASLDSLRQPPPFNPGINTGALPAIDAPAIPRSGR